MDFERGELVWRRTSDGRTPARIVVGPHADGDFVVVILCDPEHWPEGPGSADDYWGEWMYPWPVEALERGQRADQIDPPSPI
ncbi:MAG TPA: hypothetical protein VJM33_15480 [Microthrixaceae bacterium]|nr:hypothetical protein [Microthrixaceae bacterium]